MVGSHVLTFILVSFAISPISCKTTAICNPHTLKVFDGQFKAFENISIVGEFTKNTKVEVVLKNIQGRLPPVVDQLAEACGFIPPSTLSGTVCTFCKQKTVKRLSSQNSQCDSQNAEVEVKLEIAGAVGVSKKVSFSEVKSVEIRYPTGQSSPVQVKLPIGCHFGWGEKPNDKTLASIWKEGKAKTAIEVRNTLIETYGKSVIPIRNIMCPTSSHRTGFGEISSKCYWRSHCASMMRRQPEVPPDNTRITWVEEGQMWGASFYVYPTSPYFNTHTGNKEPFEKRLKIFVKPEAPKPKVSCEILAPDGSTVFSKKGEIDYKKNAPFTFGWGREVKDKEIIENYFLVCFTSVDLPEKEAKPLPQCADFFQLRRNIDGGWSKWSRWQKKINHEVRTRTCSKPAPSGMGRRCHGKHEKTRKITQNRPTNGFHPHPGKPNVGTPGSFNPHGGNQNYPSNQQSNPNGHYEIGYNYPNLLNAGHSHHHHFLPIGLLFPVLLLLLHILHVL